MLQAKNKAMNQVKCIFEERGKDVLLLLDG